MSGVIPMKWEKEKLYLLDQRVLPHTETWQEIDSIEKCHWAINVMVVRGAPCIGFTAIFGMALAIKELEKLDSFKIKEIAKYLKSSRPTAVNLEYEVDRCVEIIKKHESNNSAFSELVALGMGELELSHQRHTKMAEIAIEELDQTINKNKYRFLTHCNTGYLACGSLGTALGVISHANVKDRCEYVYADETRPYLQGSRLTAFELAKENIPHSIVVEGAASHLLRQGKVDAIYVGADRIARNGDTANKIGTSTLAIVAKHYNVPFYVVAPISSFDLELTDGSEIPIELRPAEEIKEYKGIKIAPEDSDAWNPSFDVTDASLISGIICEKGLIKPPFSESLMRIVNSENS